MWSVCATAFTPKIAFSDSPYCLLYRSFYVTLENLVFDQLIIFKLIFFSIFITYLLGMVFLMSGEILCWSLMGGRGFAWGGHKREESKTWHTEIQQKQLHKFSDLDHNIRGFLKNLFINPWVDGWLNPLTLISDKHVTSPCSKQVMRKLKIYQAEVDLTLNSHK